MYILYIYFLFQGVGISVATEMNTTSSHGIEGMDKYIEHIKELGLHTLKLLGKKIIKQIKAEKDITKDIDLVTKDYIANIQNYCDYVSKTYTNRNEGYVVEEEFIFQNIFETASQFFNRAQKQLLKEITVDIQPIKENVDRFQYIGEIIYKQYMQVRRAEFRYICDEYDICTPYPSFSDYFENFIMELLQLSDDNLRNILNHLKEILEANTDLQRVTYRVHEKDMIFKEAKILCGNSSTRQCLNSVRAMITQRFKILDCPNKKLAVRIQAARILLNVVDKTFQYSRDMNLKLDYGNTIDAIKTWNQMQSSRPPTSVMKLFIDNILKTIIMSENSLKSALIEMIVRGDSDYDGLSWVWFVPGSRGVYVNVTSSKPKNIKLHNGTLFLSNSL